MKQYVLDQLRESDYYRIKDYLDEHMDKTVFEEIYQLELPRDLYTATQAAHAECQPFYFAISLTRNQVSFEWLIRSRETLRCECISYASRAQRDYIIDLADGILQKLNIRI
jgi:hypothetical protein